MITFEKIVFVACTIGLAAGCCASGIILVEGASLSEVIWVSAVIAINATTVLTIGLKGIKNEHERNSND